ncbi:MAG: tetratricopeptide repeat protein [Pirellulales bacterium]
MASARLTLVIAMLAAGAAGCTGIPVPSFMGGPAASDLGANGRSPMPSGSADAPRMSGMSAEGLNESTGSMMSLASLTKPLEAMGSAVKKGANMVTPKPRVISAKDPLALSTPSAPPTVELYLSMARFSERTGSFEQAAEHFETALKLDPDSLDALLGYAHMYDRQGQLEKATELYRRVVSAHPNSATALNDMGLCLARRGMYPQSLDALQKAVVLQPDKKLYRNNVATVLVEMNRGEEALPHLIAAHGEATAHYNLGVLMHNHGQADPAAAQFAAAIAADPNMTAARDWLNRLAPQGVARGDVPREPAQAVEVSDIAPPWTGDRYSAGRAAPLESAPQAQPDMLGGGEQHYLPSSPELTLPSAPSPEDNLQMPAQYRQRPLSDEARRPPTPERVNRYDSVHVAPLPSVY